MSLLSPAPEDCVKRTATFGDVIRAAGLQDLLSYLVRWVVELPIPSELDPRPREMGVFEALLGVIGTLLKTRHSSLMYVSCPTDRLPLLMLPLLATPIPATRLVYSVAFIPVTHSPDTSTHLRDTNGVAPLDTTFHNTSFFGSSRHEDPTSGAGFDS